MRRITKSEIPPADAPVDHLSGRERVYRIMALVWLLAVAGGLGYLMDYAGRPGERGEPSETWPAESRVRHSRIKPTLVLFAHPKCPCTRATIHELSRLLSRCHEQVDCQILFYQSENEGPEWAKTYCWRSAELIPGVKLIHDHEARLATRFGVRTSGHILLYDQSGRLMFEGGITPARGHEGANLGRDKLLALIDSCEQMQDAKSDGRVQTATNHVFGCPLHATEASASSLPNSG